MQELVFVLTKGILMKYDCPIDCKKKQEIKEKKDENSHSTVTKNKSAEEKLFRCDTVYLNHAPLD